MLMVSMVAAQIAGASVLENRYGRLRWRRRSTTSFAGSGVAAGSSAHGLAEGAGDDVHTAHNAAVFSSAAAMLTHEANCVAVVYHNQRIVLISQIADTL